MTDINETPWNDSHVRIKKGVTPYGGRTMAVQGFKQWPNGRVVIELIADTATDHKLRGMGGDVRVYYGNEVEGLSAKRLKVLQERQGESPFIRGSVSP